MYLIFGAEFEKMNSRGGGSTPLKRVQEEILMGEFVRFNSAGVGFQGYVHECLVCKEKYEDGIDFQFACTDCENEYAEWLEEKGLVVGEWDDKDHPKYQPDALKGTKWEVFTER
jgi:hypothetical protein